MGIGIGRMAYRMAMDMDKKKRKRKYPVDGRTVHARGGGRDDGYHSKNNIEDNIAAAMDNKNTLLALSEQLQRLEKTKDVQAFIQDIAADTAVDLAMLAKNGESEKVRLEAIRDILDRAGYGKVTKHAVARIDATQSKDTIISTILGAKKDLKKAGIEIIDEDIEEGSGESSEG